MKSKSYKSMPMKASGSKGKSFPKAIGGPSSKMTSSSGNSNKMSPSNKEGKVNSYGQ